MGVHNKKKIINDPLYGFIGIPNEFIFDILSHPWVGRLRNIKQVGLTHYVYPGAVHSRFQHALGALHLANLSIDTLRGKNIEITNEEANGLRIALLLHDIGHGPFSHSLEKELAPLDHEQITDLAFEKLKLIWPAIELAQSIFKNTYPRPFLHQLVSGQFDLDRLDYLNRDSFYTGVSEGVVSFDRIIKMLNVHEGNLVVEEKAIYSIEKFLIARRLMYWQVYLHKTVISAERLLIHVIQRAKEIYGTSMAWKENLYCAPGLKIFLEGSLPNSSIAWDLEWFESFMTIDDSDIWVSIKSWINAKDPILSILSTALVHRNLYQITLQDQPFDENYVREVENQTIKRLKISMEEVHYFAFTGIAKNLAYNQHIENISLLTKKGTITPFLETSDFFNSTNIVQSVEKYFLCSWRF